MPELYNKNLTEYARKNRKSGNLSEALLWNNLKGKKLGYGFTKQKPIGNYIVDFYCKELKLVIEVDGCSHANKIDYDVYRDKYMESSGIKILHIEDVDVKRDINMVMGLINGMIGGLVGEPSPSAVAATPPQEGNK